MTEQELDLLRLKLRLQALEVLVRGLYVALASLSPSAPQALRVKFEALRKETALVAVKGYPPEYSDMIAAEYQTATDDLLSFIEKGFDRIKRP